MLERRTKESPGRVKAVVFAGPTASGKSALAVEVAQRFGGEVVNADSMQVYRGMNIGTATPPLSERKGVPHHMLDVVEPDEEFNAAIYCSLAAPFLSEVVSKGKVPLIVGGTGLYIKALFGGLLECPPIDLELREKLQHDYRTQGPAALHMQLEKMDSESACRIHPNDRVRVTRALEIIRLTGRPLSQLISGHGFNDNSFQTLKFALDVNREELYRRINERSLQMVEEGLVAETKTLLKEGYTAELKPMRSLGYRHIVKFIEGTWTLDEAILQMQKDTRHYAKRQITWFKSDPEMVWISPEDFTGITDKIQRFLGEG
ncbi:tRNA (adenosine(37)-N6)-dimethylallyltransferase MiaA [Thermodesulfobacteriota bacterium]